MFTKHLIKSSVDKNIDICPVYLKQLVRLVREHSYWFDWSGSFYYFVICFGCRVFVRSTLVNQIDPKFAKQNYFKSGCIIIFSIINQNSFIKLCSWIFETEKTNNMSLQNWIEFSLWLPWFLLSFATWSCLSLGHFMFTTLSHSHSCVRIKAVQCSHIYSFTSIWDQTAFTNT